MKQALTVDLWDTLIYDDPKVERARRDLRLAEIGRILEQECGFNYEKSWEQMMAAYEISRQHLEKSWLTGQEFVPAEQLNLYLGILFEEKVSKDLPEEELLKAYLEPILNHLPFSMPGANETTVKLKQKGWKLGLISNTGRTSGVYLRQVLQKHGIFELFDTFSFSDELSLRKPNPAIFAKTLKELGANPIASSHLGDNWEADIEGAQQAGLIPLWFCRNGKGAPDPAVRQVKNWLELEVLLQD